MSNSEKSSTYEVVPASFCFPPVQIPEKRPPTNAGEPSLDTLTLRFPETTLNESNKRSHELVRECKRSYPHKIPHFVRILEDNPHLLFIEEIRTVWLKLVEQGRVYKPTGRPSGIVKHNPLYLAAVIKELLAQNRVKNLKEAFEWCERFGMASSTARGLWYRAWADPRFKPLFVTDEASAHPATDEELAVVQRSPLLAPGGSVSTTLSTPDKGNVTVKLSAAASKKVG